MRQPSTSASSSPAIAKAGGVGRGGATTTMSNNKTTPCCSKVGLKRGPWTPEEDELLGNYIKREGEGRWRTLPKRAGLLRCGKSCRLRWMNYLRPNVKRGHIAPDEEDLILRLHRLLGNRWSLIAGRIPGRTDNEIKNYWNTHLSKKLINQGIDPRTHKPLITSTGSTSADQEKPSSNPNYNTSNPNPNYEDQVFNSNKGNNSNGYYHAGTNLQNRDASGLGNEDELDEDDEINYCTTDDMFMSSFLNSLINEDVFNNGQHQLHQMGNVGNVTVGAGVGAGAFDPLICHPSNFAFGAGWENPIMSSSGYNALNQNETKRFSDAAME